MSINIISVFVNNKIFMPPSQLFIFKVFYSKDILNTYSVEILMLGGFGP